MPSKLVPAQQLPELSDGMVRLGAAKDAEIAGLIRKYEAGVQSELEVIGQLENAQGEIAALTKDRAENSRYYEGVLRETEAEIAALTEQLDRAMKVVEAALLWLGAGDKLTAAKGDRLPANKAFSEAGVTLRKIAKEYRAALDAKAAAETAPSLPETPEAT